MKQAVKVITLLLCGYGASASAIGRQDDKTGEAYHAPCTQDGYKQFLIRDWHGVTYSNSVEIFSFVLHANFSGGDASSGWTACEVQHRSAGVDAYFDFASNDYVTINHTYVCDRGEEATGDGRLMIGLVDTPEDYYTGTEGDNMTIAAYTEVARRLPSPDCSAASREAEWKGRDFHYSTRVAVGNPWGIGATVGNVNYDLCNKANDYLINCQAVNDWIAVRPDSPELISPETAWPCPIDYRDDLIPPGAYTTTTSKFNRGQNKHTIEQEWDCSDDGQE
ncbi:hypothetical protein GGR53DRAFT_532279 [Hypoxylon sp. FL1150]|nr:hypothetical protein GGR53DRAFT_532279 [Hypoxylon sp. FL1150]